MGITVDTVQLRFGIKPEYDQQQLNQLQEDLKNVEREAKKTRSEIDQNTKEYKKLNEQLRNMKDNRDQLAAQKTRTDKEQEQLDRLNKRIKEYTQRIEENKEAGRKLSETYQKQAIDVYEAHRKLEGYQKEVGLNKLSLNELNRKQRELNTLVRELKPGTDNFERYTAELKEVNAQIELTKKEIYGTKEALEKTEGWFGGFIDKINAIGFAITNALAIKDRIVQWADQYVQSFAQMDDAMTDVMKYTGQTKREVEEMNETFKGMTTRTPREELNALAGAAGRLGIQGRKDIEGFVDAADKINVALGDDLGEGAIDQIGKLTMVFGEDKTKGLNGAMLATGSAINVLGANSSANTGFITEFTSSMAGMAVNAKISQTDIMGYASALSQAGIEGQTASGVFAQLITKMFTDPARFAKAARLDVKAFTDLLKTDANAAILQFLEGLKQNGGFDALAPALKSLKMQGTQAVPVISSLISKMDELKKAQQDARQAYDEGTSIIEEFNNANSSAAAKLEIAKKKLNDVSVELGQKLMPIVEGGIETSKIVLQVLSAIAGFVTRNIGLLSRLAIGIGGYTAAIQIATNATKIWNVVTKATPWGLCLAGLTALLVAYDKYKTRMAEVRRLREELNKVEADAVTKYSNESREIKRLDSIMRDERISIDERRKALNKLKEIIPDYNGMLDEEGRLTRDNKKAIDDYLVSLQKQIKLKAYQDKLQELYTRQADQEEEQRTASDKYWNTKQTNSLQGMNNSPTMSLMRWLGIGEEASLKRSLDEADKALADTNNKITTLESRIRDLGGSTIAPAETNNENDGGSGDSGGSGGGGKTNQELKKEQAERDRQRKELEAQAKAAYEREKLELRQQYEGKKHLQDEWHQKQYTAETRYLAKIGSLRDEYNADESEKMEVQNKLLDAIIREANYQEEVSKRKQQESLRNIDQYQAEEEMRLIRQQLDGEIKTQEEFNQKKLESEIKYQKMRIEHLKAGSAEYLAAQKQLLSMELQQMQANEKEKEQFKNSYHNTGNQSLQNVMSDLGSFDERMAMNQAYYDADLISFQQYQENKTAIEQEQTEARRDIEDAAVDLFNQGIAAAQQLFQAAQQRETSAVDAKYKKLIAAAKKQGKDTTKLEEQQEAEKMEIKKKYAQKEFQLKVLQIVSSTAMAIADVWSKWAGTPYVAAALTALAVANGAVQLAAAKSAADQAAGLYEGGYSDEYQEGYTSKGDPRKQSGVIPVHRNEFVANHKAVANPEVKPVLDVIDRHQKAGDISLLNSTRLLEEAYGRGRYRGGYSQGGEEGIPDNMENPLNGQAPNSEAMQLLRRIADKMEDALTIREVRDEIRHQESLEARARR